MTVGMTNQHDHECDVLDASTDELSTIDGGGVWSCLFAFYIDLSELAECFAQKYH